MLVVPDASVILKWVLPGEREPHALEAREIRNAYLDRECDLLVPALWLFEVGNILALKFADHAAAQLELLCALDMPEQALGPEVRHLAITLVRRYGVTFYDASYHALALQAGGILVTADQRYLRRAAEAGGARFLGDW